jgi:hypothetical protein
MEKRKLSKNILKINKDLNNKSLKLKGFKKEVKLQQKDSYLIHKNLGYV